MNNSEGDYGILFYIQSAMAGYFYRGWIIIGKVDNHSIVYYNEGSFYGQPKPPQQGWRVVVNNQVNALPNPSESVVN